MLAKKPADRHASAAVLAAALRALERDWAQPASLRRLRGFLARRRVLALAAAVLALLPAPLLLRRWISQPTPFTERGCMLIADFENLTGEPVFDQTLREGLTLALQQSRSAR